MINLVSIGLATLETGAHGDLHGLLAQTVTGELWNERLCKW